MMGQSRYISPELFHFVGRAKRDNKSFQYELLIAIIKSGKLKSFADKRNLDPQDLDPEGHMYSGELTKVPAVCFCDIPIESLGLHIQKYGKFGVSFGKQFLIAQGARPVIYVPNNAGAPYISENLESHIGKRLKSLLSDLMRLTKKLTPVDANAADEKIKMSETVKLSDDDKAQEIISRLGGYWPFVLANFYYYLKFYDDTKSEDDPDNYYTEREWRVVRNDVKFSIGDIRTIIAPREFSEALNEELPKFEGRIHELE